MGKYVDGFVVPVPRDRIDDYLKLEKDSWQLWLDHGAESLTVCLADDVSPGKLTSFPQSVDLKEDETVALAWIVYASREERDRVNAAVMADPRLENLGAGPMPFDGARMFWGGFTIEMELAGTT